jgi:acyl-CoA dehydrogenase
VKAPTDLRFFDLPADGLAHRAWADADRAVRHAEQSGVLKGTGDVHADLRAWARTLGDGGVFAWVVAARDGGHNEEVSALAITGARERLAYSAPLADLALAIQGLGSYGIGTHGSDALRAEWLPGVRSGTTIAALALTEPEAGSDLGNVQTSAKRDGDHYVLDGEKAFISNAGVSDFFVVLARTGAAGTPKPLSAFVVPSTAAGLSVTPQEVLGAHPIGRVHFRSVRVPASSRLGEEGAGMAVALGTLHRFRTTVGAAAVGFAARALDETRHHVTTRHQFGAPLASLQAVQIRLADMASELTAARVLVYRAARLLDEPGIDRETQSEATSIAKLVATESAQRIIDHAVQLHGGVGVLRHGVVAQLYEEVRSLRIYEGTTDVQKLLIARSVLAHKHKE